MQKLITKYGLAAHLAFLAVAPLFLSSTAVIWLAALAMVWILVEPSRIGDEMLHDAQRRVCFKVITDPLFWVTLALVIVALVRFLNTGVALAYDAENSAWSISSPHFQLLPGGVDGKGFDEFAGVVAVFVLLQGVRHALGRSARESFLLFASFFAGAVAALWMFCGWRGHAEQLAMLSLSDSSPSYIGGFFGIMFSAAIAALSAACERKWYQALPLLVVGIAGNGAGLFAYAPPLVAAGFIAVGLIVLAYEFIYIKIKIGETAEFKILVFWAGAVVLGVMFTMTMLDKAAIDERIVGLLNGQLFHENFLALRNGTSELSLRMWKIHPWMGSGLGSFPLDINFYATASDWEVIPAVQNAPLNGYWMLLVERGTIGAFMLAAPLMILVYSYFKNLILGVRVALPPPSAIIGLLVLLAYFAEALIDVSWLLPLMMSGVAVVFAISGSSFPKEKRYHG